MTNPIIYVVLNGELKMSPGKAAAQAVHAAMMLSANAHGDFLKPYRRTVVVLEAKDQKQIENLSMYLDEAEIESDYYIDEGVNEVDAYSVTALVAGPIEKEDTEKREIFADLPLYPHASEVRKHKLFAWGIGLLFLAQAVLMVWGTLR